MSDQPAAERLEQTLFEVKKVIVGQDRVVERLLVCLLAKGHALLEGVPGLAKTLAAETIAKVVGGSFTRIQFTPDLLPADVMGTRIYRADTGGFDLACAGNESLGWRPIGTTGIGNPGNQLAPEPGTNVLLATGVVGLGMVLRRRRAS